MTDPFDGFLYFSNRDGSAVIPARGNYSTQVRVWPYEDPAFDFYMAEFPPSWLGSGRPGDANVQLGVNIWMTGEDPAFGTFQFYNYSLDYLITETSQVNGPDNMLYTYEITILNSGSLPTADPAAAPVITSVSPSMGPYEPAGLGILLEAGMTLKSISVDAVSKPVPDRAYYNPGVWLEWLVPVLNPGKSLKVTLEALGPTGRGPQQSWVSFYGWDGQADRGDIVGGCPFVFCYGDPRGEWFYENTATVNNNWFPSFLNGAPPVP